MPFVRFSWENPRWMTFDQPQVDYACMVVGTSHRCVFPTLSLSRKSPLTPAHTTRKHYLCCMWGRPRLDSAFATHFKQAHLLVLISSNDSYSSKSKQTKHSPIYYMSSPAGLSTHFLRARIEPVRTSPTFFAKVVLHHVRRYRWVSSLTEKRDQNLDTVFFEFLCRAFGPKVTPLSSPSARFRSGSMPPVRRGTSLTQPSVACLDFNAANLSPSPLTPMLEYLFEVRGVNRGGGGDDTRPGGWQRLARRNTDHES